VPSSLLDLDCLTSDSVKEAVNRALSSLPDKRGTAACVRIPQRNGWVFRDGPYRIVFRVDNPSRSIVVLGIAAWACNPVLKVWRYLDQRKAEDLLRTGELYFRRADLLEDRYEATPTLGSQLNYQAALQQAIPGVLPPRPTLVESHKHCTYLCCWRMSHHESWLAWKYYCSRGGGLAVQTTRRKLIHLHARLRQTDEVHCREVTYLEHRREEFEGEGLGEEAFYKATWFSDEREIRLLRFHDENISVSREDVLANPGMLPEGARIRCNLSSFVDSVVINPFATKKQRTTLTMLIREHQPSLLARLHRSAILEPPVGAP
jgi:mRNA-degrading endonuclease RelE of RelBE toxin-antitoxin system